MHVAQDMHLYCLSICFEFGRREGLSAGDKPCRHYDSCHDAQRRTECALHILQTVRLQRCVSSTLFEYDLNMATNRITFGLSLPASGALKQNSNQKRFLVFYEFAKPYQVNKE